MNYEEMYGQSDTLVFMGGEVKSLGKGKFAGGLCLFTEPKSPDLAEDFFSGKTDYDIENGDRRSGYYNHGMDIKIGNTKIGTGTLVKDDAAVWLEGQLKDRDAYVDAVYDLIEQGKLGLSSGAVAHLVRREKVSKSSNVHHITHWPIGEWSLTPTPAEPRTIAVPLKSWFNPATQETPAAPETKAAVSITTVRAFEEFLRDAGFPKDAAVTIASKGFDALRRRDAEELDDQSDTFRGDALRELARTELQYLRQAGVAL